MKVQRRKMSESIEEIAKQEDPKNVYKQRLRSFHTLRGLNQHLRTCSKLIDEPKEPPGPPGKKIKTVVHVYATHGEEYQITTSKRK